MKVGTKSLLFGVHQFILHPVFVLIAWIRLYGWKTLSSPIIVAIIIHDWGYWGCEMMDDEKGEKHPEWAADVMDKLFPNWHEWIGYYRFSAGKFVLYHSRFLAKNNDHRVSRLCLADKLGSALMPVKLYVLLGKATGEIYEYMAGHGQMYRLKANDPHSFFLEYRVWIEKILTGQLSIEPWRENK